MGRKKLNFEQMPARFPDGTFARMDAVLDADENRSDFLRRAVEAEIKRRERRQKKQEHAQEEQGQRANSD